MAKAKRTPAAPSLDLFAAPATPTKPAPALDYAALIAQACEFVPEGIRVEMCRNESVTVPTFWLFRDKSQIGAVVWELGGALPWRGTRMDRGMPFAQRKFVAMDEALRFATSWDAS